MPIENPVRSHESHMQGERLYASFLEGLRLVSALERRYACKVAGVEPERLNNVGRNFTMEELVGLTNNLRDLFYGRDQRAGKYDELIDKAVEHNIEPDREAYAALEDPEMLEACKSLARFGFLSEVTQYRVDEARVKQHEQRHGRHLAVGGTARAVRSATQVDDLIKFNHMARDLADGPLGHRMNLDRNKMQEILRTVMLGDRTIAETVEHGTAIEISAMKIFRHDLDAGQAVYGDIPQDKKGGDIVLFPGSREEVFVDVKQTPPNEIRRHLSYEDMEQPGIHWKNNHKVTLWLGTKSHVGSHYMPPPEFVDKTRELLSEIRAEAAVA
jgi:hypothetical protein